jgi:hypothetical protein
VRVYLPGISPERTLITAAAPPSVLFVLFDGYQVTLCGAAAAITAVVLLASAAVAGCGDSRAAGGSGTIPAAAAAPVALGSGPVFAPDDLAVIRITSGDGSLLPAKFGQSDGVQAGHIVLAL